MEQIVLKVGGRVFQTTKYTLRDSVYFRGYFSDQPGLGTPCSPDGSYFVDLDGDIFEHILRYLQTDTKPFLWKPKDGFDYDMYHRIRMQAQFLGVEGLVSWIDKKLFEEVVNQKTSIKVVHYFGLEADSDHILATSEPGSTIRIIEKEESKNWRNFHVCGCPKAKRPCRGFAKDTCKNKDWVKVDDPCLRFIIETTETKIDLSKLQ